MWGCDTFHGVLISQVRYVWLLYFRENDIIINNIKKMTFHGVLISQVRYVWLLYFRENDIIINNIKKMRLSWDHLIFMIGNPILGIMAIILKPIIVWMVVAHIYCGKPERPVVYCLFVGRPLWYYGIFPGSYLAPILALGLPWSELISINGLPLSSIYVDTRDD